MKVKELIEALQKVDNQDAEVFADHPYDEPSRLSIWLGYL